MALAVVSAVPVSSSVITRVAVGRRVSARAHAYLRAVFFLAPAAFYIVAVVVVAGSVVKVHLAVVHVHAVGRRTALLPV